MIESLNSQITLLSAKCDSFLTESGLQRMQNTHLMETLDELQFQISALDVFQSRARPMLEGIGRLDEVEYVNNNEFVPAEQMIVVDAHNVIFHDDNHSGDEENDSEETFYFNDEFFEKFKVLSNSPHLKEQFDVARASFIEKFHRRPDYNKVKDIQQIYELLANIFQGKHQKKSGRNLCRHLS